MCTGNTCRSPVAEKLMSKYIKQAKLDLKVCSCGVDIVKGENISPNSTEALKAFKISAKKRLAKPLNKTLLKSNPLFITMTKHQKSYFPQGARVFSFGELVGKGDILDPYGQDQSVYNQMANQINEYCIILIEKLKNIKGEQNWLYLLVTMQDMFLKKN